MSRPTIMLTLMALMAAPACGLAQTKQPAPPPGKNTMTCEQALKVAPKDDVDLAPLAKSLADTEAKLKKNPKDPAAKKTYVDAAYKYGDTIMRLDRGKLSAAVQYRAALALFRRALAVDPKHEGSLAEKKEIDDIYKGMGGIPK